MAAPTLALPDRRLHEDEEAEAADLGSRLANAPASVFLAGEFIWLTGLALRGGARTLTHLNEMRLLVKKLEVRIAAGFWLDPFPPNQQLPPPPTVDPDLLKGN